MSPSWYYQLFNEVFGPVTWESMQELASSGQLGSTDLVRDGEGGIWQPASEVAGLIEAETATTEKPAAPQVRETRWMCRVNNRDIGPYNLQAMQDLVADGTLTSNDLIRETHEQTWTKAKMLPGLFIGQVVKPRASFSSSMSNAASPPEPAISSAAAVNSPPPWYWKILGKELGPFTLEEFQQLICRGELNEKHRVKQDGSNWTEAGHLPELFPQVERTFLSIPAAASPLEPATSEPEFAEELPDPVLESPSKIESPSKVSDSSKTKPGGKKSGSKKRGKEVDPLDYLMEAEPPVPVETRSAARSTPAFEATASSETLPEPPRATPAPPVANRPPSPVSAPPSPTPRPAGVDWASVNPPPKKSSSFSNPFSGLGDMLSGLTAGGGGGASTTQIALLVVSVLVLAIWFLPGMFGGDSGLVKETQDIFQKADELMKKKAPDGEWQKLAAEIKPVMEEHTKDLTKNPGTPVRQILLYCYRDQLPGILTGPEKERQVKMKLMQDLLNRANEMVTGPNTGPPPAEASSDTTVITTSG